MKISPQLLTSLFFITLTSALQAQVYSLIDLGTAGGKTSSATAINNSGQVIGRSSGPSQQYYSAVLFSGTGTGNMVLSDPNVSYYGSALGINDSGVIVGYGPVNGGTHALIFSTAGTTDIGTLGGTTNYAYSINNNGIVAGSSISSNGGGVVFTGSNSQAARFDNNGQTIVNLGGLGTNYSGATAINNNNQVVGQSSIPSLNGTDYRATLFSGTGTGNTNLGSLGGESYATDINDLGQVVGYAEVGAAEHAVLYSGTGTGNTDLGTLGGANSHASAINISGQIVGFSAIPVAENGENARGFIYRNGAMVDINKLLAPKIQAIITSCVDINNGGQIAANGRLKNVIYGRAYRLDPISKPVVMTILPSPVSKGSASLTNYYQKNTYIVLVAQPNVGKKFLGWYENNKLVSKSKKYRFKATKARKLVAKFK